MVCVCVCVRGRDNLFFVSVCAYNKETGIHSPLIVAFSQKFTEGHD